MQSFMPGTQPRGTYAFDPNKSSSQSATQVLSIINAEEEREEDQVGPPVDSFAVHDPVAPTISSAMPSSHAFSTGGTSSVISHPFPSTSSGSLPPPSSELAPTIHHNLAHPTSQQQADVFMGSTHSALSLTSPSDVVAFENASSTC